MASGVEARRIAYSLASAQLGVLARRQLVSRGLADNLVDHWLSTGYLLKMLPGVYTLARPADEASSLWMAAVLLGGDGAVLAGTSAAAALGIGTPFKGIDIIRRYGLPRSVRGSRPHHPWTVELRRGSVRAPEIARVGPIPVLTPSRLLIDLAGRTSGPTLRRYFVEAGREGLLTRECLSAIGSRSRDFAGSQALLGLVRNWDPSTGSIRWPPGTAHQPEDRRLRSGLPVGGIEARRRAGRPQVPRRCRRPQTRLGQDEGAAGARIPRPEIHLARCDGTTGVGGKRDPKRARFSSPRACRGKLNRPVGSVPHRGRLAAGRPSRGSTRRE